MVNFGQKTAILRRWNLAGKKIPARSSKYRLKPQWFQKNWLSIWWNHFWFQDNMTFFKISLIIAVWRVKIARFENENEDVFQIEIRLRIENVTYVTIYRLLSVNFYKNDVALKQQNGPKLDEMTDFCVFQKQHSREAKK